MIALLLLACVRPVAPVLFPEPLADLHQPSPVLFEAADDECVQAVAFTPTRPVPYLDADGVPTCRAQLVPESQVVELMADQDAAAYWQRVAEIGHSYRAMDRAWAEQHAGACWGNERSLRAELRVQRTIPPIVFVAGTILGTGIGLAAGSVATH